MRCGTDVDPVVPSWTDSASLLRWCSVDVDGADLWRTTRLSLGSVAVSFVYRRLFNVSAGLTAHSNADDIQVLQQHPHQLLYIPCVERIDASMSSNRLMMMNADKTQLLWLETRQQLNKLSVNELIQLLGARVSFSGSVSNLGVTIASLLCPPRHITPSGVLLPTAPIPTDQNDHHWPLRQRRCLCMRSSAAA